MIIKAATLLAILLVGQQQQVASAWWPFGSSSAGAKQEQQQQQQQVYQVPANQFQQLASSSARAAQQSAVNAAAGPALKAIAKFNMDGVQGHFRFSRASETAPTRIEYSLTGLKGNNRLFHVHVNPVPKYDQAQLSKNATLRAQVCGENGTGTHLNPHHVTQKLPPKSAPFDKYEVGDMAGKHGPMNMDPSEPDFYRGVFIDDKLPMSGENSIIGRSVVIHKNDGVRWVCASIERE